MAVGLFLPVAVFFLSKLFPEHLVVGWDRSCTSLPRVYFLALGIFYLVEIVPWLLLFDKKLFSDRIAVTAIICMFLIPLGHLGYFNDWTTRVPIPSMLCFAGCLIASLKTASFRRKTIFSIVYLIGLMSPVYELYASIKQHMPFTADCRPGTFGFTHSMYYVTQQYVGDPSKDYLSSTILAIDPKSAIRQPISWNLTKVIKMWRGMDSVASAKEDNKSCNCGPDSAIIFENNDRHPYYLSFHARMEGYAGLYPKVRVILPDHSGGEFQITQEGIDVGGTLRIPEGKSVVRFRCVGSSEGCPDEEDSKPLYSLSNITLSEANH
jgi:hypothetical protein